jgi:L-alanine-DL-glutamate epimerase-like enolase superfamily enzyme
LDGAGARRAVHSPRLEHGNWSRRGPAPGLAFPDTDLVEYIDGSPYVDAIVAEPWRLDGEGMLAIPDRPGLGIQLDNDAIARYADAPLP